MLSDSLLRIAKSFKITGRTKSFLSRTKSSSSQVSHDDVSFVDSLLSDGQDLSKLEELQMLLNPPNLQRFIDQDIELTPELEFELDLARLTGLIEKGALHRLGDQEYPLFA
ncbi:hypothetical protein K7432_010915 [Basidiobolus ranarum]|uniref:Uncharacterized protein n=1 Tax=Basidiobolus ranarum TaxID=34480 RepID=A0ABR2VUP9_9FUNG